MTKRWRGWQSACVGALLVASCASPDRRNVAHRSVSDVPVKIGKPYQVAGLWYYPADDRAYDEVGLASWYGARFHGGATANGERFDRKTIGAAHKTLPLPCYVEVTAIETGRRIIVRINDRGPFIAGRIIDLSQRAAELLGTARAGVARVRVRRVYPAESTRRALRAGKPAEPLPYVPRSELAGLAARFGLDAR